MRPPTTALSLGPKKMVVKPSPPSMQLSPCLLTRLQRLHSLTTFQSPLLPVHRHLGPFLAMLRTTKGMEIVQVCDCIQSRNTLTQDFRGLCYRFVDVWPHPSQRSGPERGWKYRCVVVYSPVTRSQFTEPHVAQTRALPRIKFKNSLYLRQALFYKRY